MSWSDPCSKCEQHRADCECSNNKIKMNRVRVRMYKDTGKWNFDEHLEVTDEQLINIHNYILNVYAHMPTNLEVSLIEIDGFIQPLRLITKEMFNAKNKL